MNATREVTNLHYISSDEETEEGGACDSLGETGVSYASNAMYAFSANYPISQTQAQVPSTMLHSSAVLGSGQLRNNAQRREHEEHLAMRRALDRSSHSRKRRKISRSTEIPVDEGGGGGGSSDPDENIAVGLPKRVEDFNSIQRPLERELHHLSPPLEDVHAAGGMPEKPLVVNKPVGSGLKRAPSGTLVAPRIVTRRPKPSREVQNVYTTISPTTHSHRVRDIRLGFTSSWESSPICAGSGTRTRRR